MLNSTTVTSERLGYQIADGHELRMEGGALTISRPEGNLRVPLSSGAAAVAAALSSLPVGKCIGELELGCVAAGTPRFLQYLAKLGALQRVLTSDTGPLAVVEPISDSYELKEAKEPVQTTRLRLSRFSYLRPCEGATVLESPLCHSRIRLIDPRLAAMLVKLSQPYSTLELLGGDIDGLNEFLKPALALFMAEGFVAPVTPTGEAVIDDTRTLRLWEFHDLLFHSRTRLGRHRNPTGGTFRFYGEMEPLPAVKPPMTAVRLPLARPDLRNIALTDMPLTAAVEQRTSVRTYGPSPVTLAEFSEFLYRVARVRQRTPGVYEFTSRPYPNGGASYELEIYPIVDRCQGLQPGFYHYDPLEHALEPLSRPHALTQQFLEDAWVFSGQTARPEILLMVAARFGRVSWKYASIAYATILKNIGALYQTMYLVATAMGLAPCALGSGNSDRFSELLGEDYYAETAVGEFMLGNSRASL